MYSLYKAVQKIFTVCCFSEMDTKRFDAQNGMQLSCSLAYSCKRKERKKKKKQATSSEFKCCSLLPFAYFLFFFFWCCWECEKLHQLSANETINSTEDLKGQGTGTELTPGHLFIAVTHFKVQSICESWARNCGAGLMLMCEDEICSVGQIFNPKIVWGGGENELEDFFCSIILLIWFIKGHSSVYLSCMGGLSKDA